MKKFTIFLLLSVALLAQNVTYTIPIELQKKVCEQLAQGTNRCENGSTIDFYKSFVLQNDKLLLFVYLNEHAKTFATTASATPLLVNPQGGWILGTGASSIDEDIQSIHQDPQGDIWVRALWQIEGVSPSFYHSRDAIHWKRTKLPQNREVDCCFETVEKPIFQTSTITLTFKSLDNKRAKSWVASYESAMSDNPVWQNIPVVFSQNLETPTHGNWFIVRNKKNITFTNQRTKYSFALPLPEKSVKTLYHIQLGAFKTEKSSRVVENRLKKSLPYLTYNIVATVKGKRYNKLLMGDFTSYHKAKFILNKIKREHPKEPNVQKAFIFSTKVTSK